MKYTMLVTRACNMRCSYCYVAKSDEVMPLERARQIVEMAFEHTPPGEKIDFGFFGGEPLLEFGRVREIADVIALHRDFDPGRVKMTLVSNGMIFDGEIGHFLRERGIAFGISCDGIPENQDRFRRTRGGKGSSALVERNIRAAQESLSRLMVNAVYRPETLESLPDTVAYFSGLGVRHIYLNPDYSAPWTHADADRLPKTLRRLADLYLDYYRHDQPHFINIIDGKLATLLRGGYQPGERCSMGRGEFAFTPDGGIYPCERLVGAAEGDDDHRIGHVDEGLDRVAPTCRTAAALANGRPVQPLPCSECGVAPYCMSWCGCSNFFGSGAYDRPSAFLCASERAAIAVAADLIEANPPELENLLYDHATGSPLTNSVLALNRRERPGETRRPCSCEGVHT